MEIVESIELTDERAEPAVSPVFVRDVTVNDLRIATGALFRWWGVWSLADRILLKYSPVFELVSIVIAALLYLVPHLIQWARAGMVSLKEHVVVHLQRI
jgi:hypothetical protein